MRRSLDKYRAPAENQHLKWPPQDPGATPAPGAPSASLIFRDVSGRSSVDVHCTSRVRFKERVGRGEANLYGSLALTGRGHGTDRAVLLGLSGELPDRIAPESIEPKLAAIRTAKSLSLAGTHAIAFDEARDLLFHRDKTLPFHPHGIRYRAFDAAGAVISEQVYFSIGGGFIFRGGGASRGNGRALLKRPFTGAGACF